MEGEILSSKLGAKQTNEQGCPVGNVMGVGSE